MGILWGYYTTIPWYPHVCFFQNAMPPGSVAPGLPCGGADDRRRRPSRAGWRETRRGASAAVPGAYWAKAPRNHWWWYVYDFYNIINNCRWFLEIIIQLMVVYWWFLLIWYLIEYFLWYNYRNKYHYIYIYIDIDIAVNHLLIRELSNQMDMAMVQKPWYTHTVPYNSWMVIPRI